MKNAYEFLTLVLAVATLLLQKSALLSSDSTMAASNRDIEVSMSKQVYAQTPVGSKLQIMTGKGRLGLEWIRRIDAVGQQSETLAPAKIK